MTNRTKWTRIGLAGVLIVSLVGVPQIAAAADHCDRQNYYSTGGYRSYYYGDANRAYGYGYRDYGYRDDRYYGYDNRSERSAGKSAAIIGGSSAAGAVFGALAGGGKGAAIGAALGGIGGLIFDRATRNDERQR